MGNNHSLHDYLCTDFLESLGSVTYYRLKIVDLNGQYDYSQIIFVINNLNQLIFYPNPADEKTRVCCFGESEKIISLHLINSFGEELILNGNHLMSGNELGIPLSNYPPGIYFVTIITNTQVYKHTLLKK